MRLQIRGFIVNDYLSNRAEVLDIFTKAIEERKPDVSAQSEQIVQAKFVAEIQENWSLRFNTECWLRQD